MSFSVAKATLKSPISLILDISHLWDMLGGWMGGGVSNVLQTTEECLCVSVNMSTLWILPVLQAHHPFFIRDSNPFFIPHPAWAAIRFGSPQADRFYNSKMPSSGQYCYQNVVAKMSTFWDAPPPPIVKIHNFFFLNESFP